ncbi:hypothetical protein M378DRAFT_158112 [Amanita muscaria Koide BX008]|uniref:Uncharacterized protein n=1 Tax=Amanita muscaria (strain Koide BX008) TaxID=946122 RepID=A0A0C2SZK1_AMAMK|nr:hypothetical protein M378DRAFT_158112 [Amanita muscaria Koide BX008]
MSTTTCSQSSHMRHPWFHTFATKRKVSPSDDSQQSFKRRKYSTLEHGFAHLTLTPDQDTDVPMDSSDMVAPEVSDHVVRPSSVEEPTDIKMRTSTWYEPEPDRRYPHTSRLPRTDT